MMISGIDIDQPIKNIMHQTGLIVLFIIYLL